MNRIIKKLKLFIIYLPALTLSVHAQEVTSASGNYDENNDLSISWTLGEVVINSFTADNTTLTQGFHQPVILVTSVNDFTQSADKVTAFPNPATELVFLKVNNINDSKLRYEIYNQEGELIAQKEFSSETTEISFRKLIPATYIIEVFENDRKLKSFKIIKQ